MKTHIMLDLETLGTKPGSVILSIGAVKFNREGVTDTFYRVIDPKSAVAVGLKIDIDTVFWWLEQSAEARQALLVERDDITNALNCFKAWVLGASIDFYLSDPKDIELWGNGANFDNNLLGAAYDACGLSRPWEFWNDRCYRTVKALHPDLPLLRKGTHHNALDDARSQAEHLITLPAFQIMCDVEASIAEQS